MAGIRNFDLVVIGGGPAGYVGAIRAAQLGMSVACVERDRLGGICLNWGCIPTKALLAGAEFYRRLKLEAGDWGIEAENIGHKWQTVIGRSRGVADKLNKGVHFLFKKNKITHVQGQARISKPGTISVTDPHGKTATLGAQHILIATGAVPRVLPFAPFDGQKVISYKEAMNLPDQPGKLIIIGAGAIGMEFAYFYNAYGTSVTVVEMLDRVLPNEDAEVSEAIARSFKKQGVTCLTGTRTIDYQPTADGVEITIAPAHDESKKSRLRADRLLVAIGVAGQHEGLFDPDAAALGIGLDRDHIQVERPTYRTGADRIHAVGDVIGPPWLAHVAMDEAVVCVEQIAPGDENPMAIDYDAIPACTYCVPQVASLGLTEQACQDQGLKRDTDYRVGTFAFKASGKAQALGNTEGFVKLITSARHGEILGAHLVGENVTELIAELGLAKRLEATVDDVIATMHAHPTLSEAVHEAALGAEGRMIHL